MKIRILLLCALYCLLTNCTKKNFDGQVLMDSTFADSLKASADTIQVANDKFILTVYIYRDFMPTAPERKDGSGLMTSISLININNTPLPSDIKLNRQYVIYESQIWSDGFNQIAQTPSAINAITGNGPHWQPQIFVDVVCEFETGNKVFIISSKHQQVKAVF